MLKWENTLVGEQERIDTPAKVLDFGRMTIKQKHFDKIIHKDTSLAAVLLINKFINFCGCGEGGSHNNKNEFISNVLEKHKGKFPPSSRINLPHWIYPIFYVSDEYCRANKARHK